MTSWNVRNNTAIQFDFWLVFELSGSMRLTRREPKLDRGERSIYIEAVLPKVLWETPSLRGTINVADPGAMAATFDIAATAEAIKKAVGLDIDLRVAARDEAVSP